MSACRSRYGTFPTHGYDRPTDLECVMCGAVTRERLAVVAGWQAQVATTEHATAARPGTGRAGRPRTAHLVREANNA